MIGFDNIELSMELLNHRPEAIDQISSYLRGQKDVQSLSSFQSNGRSKGKQKEGVISCTFYAAPIERVPTVNPNILDPEEARRRMEETLRANAERPLYSGTAVSTQEPGREMHS